MPRRCGNPVYDREAGLGKLIGEHRGPGHEDVRIHGLQLGLASRTLALEESVSKTAKLIGHRPMQRTPRYAHLARPSVKGAAEQIGDSLAGNMEAFLG